MSIVKSSKGHDKLLLEGYSYRRANNSQRIWRCSRNDCRGRVTFDGNQHTQTTEHVHAPNPEEIISAEFKSKITTSAATSHDPPRRIIHEALLSVDKNDAAAVPTYHSSQRTIQRKRKRNDIPLPRPRTYSEIVIPDELQITNGGARFLLYDNQDPNRRLIILSSDDDLDRLSNSEHWHSDGTFKVAPQLFYQLYTIHGSLFGRSLPLVYCFTSNKDEDIYNEMFEIILKNVSQRPNSITIDYEKAVENVVKKMLPMTTVSGCFFHFKQSLWRKLSNLGLQEVFVNDAEVRRNLKNVGCLSLIPESHVIAAFEKFQTEAPESLNDFIDYFEDNYVGRPIRGGRRRCPRFSISMWNCYGRLDKQLPRTNNSAEGWNKAIKNCVRENPSVYECIKDLQTEQHATLILAEQLQAGLVKIKKRVQYEVIDEKLQILASTFHLRPLDIYFKRARALFNF